jgi:hypothetical protein
MTEQELIEIEVRLREAIRVANENPNLTWGFNVEGELLTALVAEVRRLRAELARREDLKAWIDDARERGE